MDITAFPRQYARTRRFTLGVPHAFTVSPDGERVLFLRTRSGDRRPTDEHCSRAATLIPGSQQADEDG